MTPEGRVKQRFKSALNAEFGTEAWRFMPVQTGFGSVAHDFILCIDGLFFSVETKKDAKSEMTALQKSTKSDIEFAGGVVLLVYDDESIRMTIERLKWECEHYGRSRREEALNLNRAPQGEGQDQ